MSRRAVLTDVRWARLEPLPPSSDGMAGRPFSDDRRVVEGIIYRFGCGLARRDVPADLGPWQTLWKRHRRYAGDGTWDRVLAAVLADADAAGLVGRAVGVDSSIIRAHQHAATLTRDYGTQADGVQAHRVGLLSEGRAPSR